MWFQERPLQKEIFSPLKPVTHLVEFIKSKIQPPVCKSAQRKKKGCKIIYRLLSHVLLKFCAPQASYDWLLCASQPKVLMDFFMGDGQYLSCVVCRLC